MVLGMLSLAAISAKLSPLARRASTCSTGTMCFFGAPQRLPCPCTRRMPNLHTRPFLLQFSLGQGSEQCGDAATYYGSGVDFC